MNPVLSISMLVSRNRDTLEKCLQSLQPFFDELQAELVVVDTGAPKEAIELVKKYTDQIVSFAWCNDFSAARNAGLKVCRGEWFLYVDDDEWFEDVGEIIDFLKSEKSKQYHRLCYIQRNYTNFSGNDYQDVKVERMERRTDEMRFYHKIHEEIKPVIGEIYDSKVYVHHYGYVYKTEEEKRRHDERNLSLLIKECEDFPDDMRMQLQLLQEYLIQGMYEKAVGLAEKQLLQALSDNNVQKTPFFSWLCEMYVKTLFLLERYHDLFLFVDLLHRLPDCMELGKLAGSYYAMLACVNQSQGIKDWKYAKAAYVLQHFFEENRQELSRQEIQGLNIYVMSECREVTLQLLCVFAYQNGYYEEASQAIKEMTWEFDPYRLQHICEDIRKALPES